MYHQFYEDEDGNLVQELDDEAIEYFMQGLQELKDSDVGTAISTPSITQDDQGVPDSVGEFILMKVDPN